MGEGKLKSVLHLEELEKCEKRSGDDFKTRAELQKHCKILICKFKQIRIYLCFKFIFRTKSGCLFVVLFCCKYL